MTANVPEQCGSAELSSRHSVHTHKFINGWSLHESMEFQTGARLPLFRLPSLFVLQCF